jgi:hypothetical protein
MQFFCSIQLMLYCFTFGGARYNKSPVIHCLNMRQSFCTAAYILRQSTNLRLVYCFSRCPRWRVVSPLLQFLHERCSTPSACVHWL